MNGIEKITQRITAEAEAECRNLTEEAKKRCAAIKAEFAARAKTVYDEAVALGEKDVEEFRIRENRAARLEAKKDVLSLKRDLVQKAFDGAREKLLGMAAEDYSAFLIRLVSKAVSSGTEEVIFSEEDTASVGEKVVAAVNAARASQGLPAELTLSRETRSMDGGAVLKAGNVEVNCTLDALFGQSRDDLEVRVAGILFG